MNQEPTIAQLIGIQYPHHCAACECDPWDSVVSIDEMFDWLRTKGWEISHAWVNRVGEHAGQVTVQFMDPNKYPPEVRATWPADRFQSGHRRRDDPVETGRGWWNFTGPTLLDAFEQAVRQAA